MRNKRPLENNVKIHAFARKWVRNMHARAIPEGDDFAEDCFALGFDMDCGVFFKVTFEDERCFYDTNAFLEIAPEIHDVKLLCSAIFSRWRDIQFRRIKAELNAEQSRAEQSIPLVGGRICLVRDCLVPLGRNHETLIEPPLQNILQHYR